MTPDFAIDLIKFGLAVLAGFVAVASFLPSVLERLQTIADKSSGTILERREFDEIFNRSLNASTITLRIFAAGYLLAGFGTILLLGFVAFSYIRCSGITCSSEWVPVVGGLTIAAGLLVLLCVTGSVLTVFVKAARQGLDEVHPDDG